MDGVPCWFSLFDLGLPMESGLLLPQGYTHDTSWESNFLYVLFEAFGLERCEHMRWNFSPKRPSLFGSGRSLLRYSRAVGPVWVLCMMVLGSLLWIGCSDTDRQCDADNPCDNPLVCVGGKCERKRCSVDEDCSIQEVCSPSTGRCERRTGPTWDCRTDRECRPGEICEGGLCRLQNSENTGGEVVVPERDPNACVPTCREGFKCDKGTCVAIATDPPCKFDTDCKDGRTCNIAVDLCQLPCQSDAGCSDGRTCKGGYCQLGGEPECDANKPCTSPKTCVNGACVEPECSGEKPCPSPNVCTNNKCVEPECHSSKPCTSPKVCTNNKCEDPPEDCSGAKPCSGDKKCFRGKCVSPDYCEQDSDCTQVVKCVKNQCGFCSQNSDCFDFQACENSKCVTKLKQIGEACKASAECVQGAICAGDGGGNTACRKPCDPFASPTGCDPSDGCGLLGTTTTGACFPKKGASALKVGDDCTGANQGKCEVDLTCVNQGNGTALCMQYCNQNKPNCPSNGKCLSVGQDPVGVCEIKGGSGTGNVKPGQACNSNADCQTGAACVTAGGGTHAVNICQALCNPQAPSCPRAAPCIGTSQPGVGVCQPACSAASDCASGLCLGSSGAGTCTTGCDPYQAVCTQGQTCDVVPAPNGGLKGVCGPENTQGQSIGGTCFAGAFSCRTGLVCITLIRNSQGNLVGKCGLPCLPGSTQCPAGTRCQASTNTLEGGGTLTGCIP